MNQKLKLICLVFIINFVGIATAQLSHGATYTGYIEDFQFLLAEEIEYQFSQHSALDPVETKLLLQNTIMDTLERRLGPQATNRRYFVAEVLETFFCEKGAYALQCTQLFPDGPRVTGIHNAQQFIDLDVDAMGSVMSSPDNEKRIKHAFNDTMYKVLRNIANQMDAEKLMIKDSLYLMAENMYPVTNVAAPNFATVSRSFEWLNLHGEHFDKTADRRKIVQRPVAEFDAKFFRLLRQIF